MFRIKFVKRLENPSRNIMRKLVTIQKIMSLDPIPGADNIQVASVLGWKCVVRRDEFKVGDICAYFEIDSLLPVETWTDFLRKGDPRPFRLRTIKLRGVQSQGLALPMSHFEKFGYKTVEENGEMFIVSPS